MSENRSGFGPGFSRDVEALLSIIAAGEQTGEVYMYQHEVRQNLRKAGLVLDESLPEGPSGYVFKFEEDHQPTWTEQDESVHEVLTNEETDPDA